LPAPPVSVSLPAPPFRTSMSLPMLSSSVVATSPSFAVASSDRLTARVRAE